jgi:hypothetical protein
MSTYKNVLTAYINKRDDESQYLTMTNVSNEPVIIEVGEKVYLNRTPSEVKKKHPKVPDFTKSVKLEVQESKSEDINSDLPF